MTAPAGKIASEAGRRVNVPRPLTRPLELSEEGLAVNATRTCSIDGCESPPQARRLCMNHYAQARYHGTISQHRTVHNFPCAGCSVDDCDAISVAHGLCNKHVKRQRTRGTTDGRIKRGPGHWNWRGDDIGYTRMHERLRDSLGSSRNHDCVDCGAVAGNWSYTGNSPREKTDPASGLLYSTDSRDYEPRCLSCHSLFDRALRRARDIERGTNG